MMTPGLRYLLHTLPPILGPPSALYLFLNYISMSSSSSSSSYTYFISNWNSSWLGTPIYSIAVCVCVAALRRRWRLREERDEAGRLGAGEVPVCEGMWPGNVDGVVGLARSMGSGYIGEPIKQMFERTGSNIVMFPFMWKKQIFTIEPEHVKAILATEVDNFVKDDDLHEQLLSVFGDGVFNANGDVWKFHRSMTRPFFARERIADFEIFGRYADALVGRLVERTRMQTGMRMREDDEGAIGRDGDGGGGGGGGGGYAVDMQDALARFTLDSATEFLFGRCVHALDQGLPYPDHVRRPGRVSSSSSLPLDGFNKKKDKEEEKEESITEIFGEALEEAQKVLGERALSGPMWPLLELSRDRTEEPMRIVRAFVRPILEDAVRKRREKEEEDGEGGGKGEIEDEETLLDYLVRQTEDEAIIQDEIINILIAGRDTTACLLTFTVYLLAEKPEVVHRLRAEIIEHVGLNDRPTYDQIRKMKYLRAVLNETLRLYPPVPFDGRTSVKAATLPNPTPGGKPWYIPPKTGVAYSVFLMHRRKDLWGPDAEEFDPDRFIDERLHKYLTPNPFIFLPFNAGPRICLGQQFAYNEASFMLVRLLQTFDAFELDSEAQPVDSLPPQRWKTDGIGGRQGKERISPKMHLTLYVYKGLWMRLREAPKS